MTNKIRGGAFRLTGLILGIVGATVSLTAIVFSTGGYLAPDSGPVR